LSGNWANAVVVFIITSTIGYITSVIPLTRHSGFILITGPLAYGVTLFYLGIIRNSASDFNFVFKGFDFSEKSAGIFFRTVGAYLLSLLFISLWMLLLIVPGVVAALGYSMIFYIFADNPDIGISESMQKSKKMMYGYKGKLFMLQLSFFGWGILCIFTFGIGFLWLGPYMQTANTEFYLELIKEQGEVEEEHKTEESETVSDEPIKIGGVSE
jgi:uncharacterized membrane protein